MDTGIASKPPPESSPPVNRKDLPKNPFQRPSSERLSMSFDQRFFLACTSGALCGLVIGSSHAGRNAGLRFRAENAHRLPTSPTGWYLYHKSKNYYRARAGVREGIGKGIQMAAWVGLFFIIEESVDIFRGSWMAGRTMSRMQGVDELDVDRMHSGVEKSRDFFSTTCAGATISGLWSVVNRFPVHTAARTVKVGLLVGLGYGLAQDAIATLKGQRIGYVEWIRNAALDYKSKDDAGSRETQVK